MLKAAAKIAALIALFALTGCSSINSWLADELADHIPTWAGGLPADAPPRVTDPRYVVYQEAHGNRVNETPNSLNTSAPIH